ncbi:zinc finger protein [Colletotrichum godetiae]|uniref:Zinc finger protein n=1 Tax=Colletotrichum godetiae TaxID=1209918 RepID=A0AAJ0AN33_9PEZI|nr:zinc finger protein [Colletotrichum godetiae]KAK1676916.1 zinc finger protein [Colletotrichum godetiae]
MWNHWEGCWECDTCDRTFGSEHAMQQHMNALGHWDYDDQPEPSKGRYECNDCNDRFHDEQDLREHEVEYHNYCDPCDRYFNNQNNIRQHLNSSVHRASSDIQCPFCRQTSDTATGLIHHLERGACPSAPLDRDKLYQAVRARDPNGECYLCHRAFSTLKGLNQHLNSPIHQQKLYHCPNHRCGREFTTLAAAINHLESESCGYMRFKAVQQNVGQILDPRRMLSF